MSVEEYAYFLEHPNKDEVEGWTLEVWRPRYATLGGRDYVMSGDEENGTPVECLIRLTREEYEWMHYEYLSDRTSADFESEYRRVLSLLSADADDVEISHLRKSVAWSVRLGGSTESYFSMFY